MTDLIDYLYSLTNFTKGAYTLDNMRLLIKELKLNDPPYRCIHVAGTNGKGSVCHKIATVLAHSGYKTGLFTSPHIATFRERIKIDGEMIDKTVAYSTVERILDTYKKNNLSPTFFEVITLLALLHFKNEGVQYAVIETGLGGRLDATNVISPILSIITSISLDHTHILGDTLEKISYEKGGIIKEFTPSILGPSAQIEPILSIAKKKKSPLFKIEDSFLLVDQENTKIARKALSFLEKKFSLELIHLEKHLTSRPSCRFEIIDQVVFDVAHNPAGIGRLILGLQYHFPGKKFRFLIGLSCDKNLLEIVEAIGKVSCHTHLISLKVRLYPVDMLEKAFLNLNFSSFSYEKNLVDTVRKAHALSLQNDEVLVVTGSFFIMQEVKKQMGFSLESDPVFFNEKLSAL